ncbi:Crp/Fnr family transcriptional regulator [Campylobacter geochelonis]|uniref:Crp/Fnr family transcriptional regulator n=1 Tax=Campylobacter geochelonis TaxID=1780362 RepID=UPI000770AE90|nr:Crp/Fnr family transcriptional regulator [Campylobacter geochelonis]CZE49961.1 Crp/Fnr family transcriptional regulator [Campylobacter geochelonis]
MLKDADRVFLEEKFLSKFDFSDEDREKVIKNCKNKFMKKNEILYQDNEGYYGYIIIKNGILRAYVTSNTLKEITIFRVKSGEECILSSNYTTTSFGKELNFQIEECCEFLFIPMQIYQELKEKYPSVTNHTLKLISKKFSSVIEVIEQALFLPLSDRIRIFLEQNCKNKTIKITHEQLANHLGSAREAISRTLKDMEKSGEIERKRGFITILSSDFKRN